MTRFLSLMQAVYRRKLPILFVIYSACAAYYAVLFLSPESPPQEETRHPILIEHGPHWVDLAITDRAIKLATRELALVFQARLSPGVDPSTLDLRDSFGTDLLRQSEIAGEGPLFQADKFIASPAIDYLPTVFDVNLSYQEPDRDEIAVTKAIHLRYLETFSSLKSVSDPFTRYWVQTGPQVLVVSDKLSMRTDSERSGIIFQLPHRGRVDFSLKFESLSTTPNLEIAFSEHESIIIGDSLLTQNRFKYAVLDAAGRINSLETRRTIPVPSRMEVGQEYRVSISKRYGSYDLIIKHLNSKGPPYSTKFAVPKNRRPEQKKPFVQIWALPNTYPSLRRIPADLLVDDISIFFPVYHEEK